VKLRVLEAAVFRTVFANGAWGAGDSSDEVYDEPGERRTFAIGHQKG
jgi:hypothetical protein